MKTLNLLALCLLITGCAVGYSPRYYYSNIEVANLTGETIRNLNVQVGAEGRNLACDEVTKNRICQQRFGKIPYPNDVVDVNWQSGDGAQRSVQLSPSIPLTMVPSLRLRLLLEIAADGSVKAQFKQDDLRLGQTLEPRA